MGRPERRAPGARANEGCEGFSGRRDLGSTSPTLTGKCEESVLGCGLRVVHGRQLEPRGGVGVYETLDRGQLSRLSRFLLRVFVEYLYRWSVGLATPRRCCDGYTASPYFGAAAPDLLDVCRLSTGARGAKG